jgi:hypothetical protein
MGVRCQETTERQPPPGLRLCLSLILAVRTALRRVGCPSPPAEEVKGLEDAGRALVGNSTPTPWRVREGQAGRHSEGMEKVASMLVRLSRLSSRPPVGSPAPPLSAFGPGSRSCDVISKASALSSLKPCPAGPAAQALFTESGRGERRRNQTQAPKGYYCRGSSPRGRPYPHRVSTCRRARAATYGTQARSPSPQFGAPFANQQGRADGCNILAFCNSRAQYKTEGGR